MNYFRDLTDDECKIYDSWINHESIKTGENLFNDSKPKTNGDRIRQMTDEQLAEMLNEIKGCIRNECSRCPLKYVKTICCTMSIAEWLRKEVDEDGQS